MLYFNDATISPWVLSSIHTQQLKLKYHIKNAKSNAPGRLLAYYEVTFFFLKALKQRPFLLFKKRKTFLTGKVNL
jgi:acyl-CoA thioesterase FadM